MSSITSCWRSSDDSRIPNARFAVRRSGVITALREVRRHRVQQRADAGLGRSPTAAVRNSSDSDSAGHSSALLAAALGRVAVALEHRRLVVAHPLHDRRLGEVVALHDDVDLPRDAGRLLQRLEVLHGRQVLRHEPLDVRHDLGARVDRPADRRDGQPDRQHAARAARSAARTVAARHPARGRGERARHRVAGARDQLAGAAQRSRERPVARTAARADVSAAVPAVSASSEARSRCRPPAARRTRAPSAPATAAARGSPTPVASAAVAITGTATRAARTGSPSSATRAWYWIA